MKRVVAVVIVVAAPVAGCSNGWSTEDRVFLDEACFRRHDYAEGVGAYCAGFVNKLESRGCTVDEAYRATSANDRFQCGQYDYPR